jgi:MoaA/NifB/PqqE/SkfB family radical SAM enzyme
LVKWKQLDDGNITSINGKYYYFNDTAKEILVHLIKTGKPIATVDYISNKYGLSEEESIKWVNAVNRNYDEIDQYYSEVHKLESPLKVQWKITEQCNLRCMHCYNGTTCEKTFDLDKINVIADKICEWDVFEVTLTGGEIFTVPNIQSIMKKLLDRNIKITLFTNGTLIFPYLDFLQKYSSMLHVNISIDGIKEYHDQIRGMGTFDLAIRAIKEMKKRGIKVTTNTVIAKLNYGQMDKLINQLSNYDVNIQFSHLIIKGNAAKNKNVLLMNEEENKKFKNIIIKACSICLC